MIDVDGLTVRAVNEYSCAQKPTELAQFGRLVLDHGCKTVLEIGTLHGGSAWFLAELGCSVTTFDIDHSKLIHRDDRVWYVLINEMIPKLQKGTIDLLHIDGDHTYEACKRDWGLYHETVKKGGLVALHDSRPYPDYGVDRFFAELGEKYRTEEIYDSHFFWRSSDWGGMGIVYV